MHYFAVLNPNHVCVGIDQVEDSVYDECISNGIVLENESNIEIPTNDTDKIYRKKYINGNWVDSTPHESMLQESTALVHYLGADDMFLSDAIGQLATLLTTAKGSLVAAVNECFQNASDGKTAIANAITGVDESITIPDNPTFAQLAACIGMISTGLQVETGSMNVYTIPTTIDGTTSFQPKIVIVYNFGSGLSNFNMGVYVSPEVTGVSSQQISDSANGIGNKLSRRANPFTITETGFSMVNTGAAINLKWIALG